MLTPFKKAWHERKPRSISISKWYAGGNAYCKCRIMSISTARSGSIHAGRLSLTVDIGCLFNLDPFDSRRTAHCALGSFAAFPLLNFKEYWIHTPSFILSSTIVISEPYSLSHTFTQVKFM